MAADSPDDLLALAVHGLHDVMLVADLDGTIRVASDSVERVFGVPSAEVVGSDLGRLLGGEARATLQDTLERRGHIGFDVELGAPGGERRWLQVRANHVRDASGRPGAIAAVIADISDRRRGDEIMRALVHSIEQGAVAFVLLADDGTISYVNRTFCELYGYSAHEMVGQSVELLSAEPDPAAHYRQAFAEARATGVWRGEDLRRHKEGTAFHASATLSRVPDRDGKTLCFSEASRDIRERVEQVAHLTALSIRDAVTGIYNRRYFNDFLAKAWGRAVREDRPLALVIADIDHFKRYNDHYGHVQGDECLSRVAQAMAGVVRRPGDALCRYGGEEFAAVLGDTESGGAEHVAEGLRAAVAALGLPHERSPVAETVTVSVGMAVTHPRSTTAQSDGPLALVRAADQALYRAKAGGRDRVDVMVVSEDPAAGAGHGSG